MIAVVALMRFGFGDGFLPQQLAGIAIQANQVELINFAGCPAAASTAASALGSGLLGVRVPFSLLVGFDSRLEK